MSCLIETQPTIQHNKLEKSEEYYEEEENDQYIVDDNDKFVIELTKEFFEKNKPKIATQEYTAICSLGVFYENLDNLNIVNDLLENKLIDNKKISLRMIDSFVCNYAKIHNTTYLLENGKEFNVYDSYRNELKGNHKQIFDPFRRNSRIYVRVKNANKILETTIAQLNYFRWIITNNILKYILDNFETINEFIKKKNSLQKKNTEQIHKKNTRKKKDDLFLNQKTMKKETGKYTVPFSS